MINNTAFPGSSVVENPPAMQETQETRILIPGSGRPPGGGYGNPLEHSCLEIPNDRRAWWAIVCRVTKSQTTEMAKHTHMINNNGKGKKKT